MASPRKITTESVTGERPEPSISVAPTIATVSSAARDVNSVVAATSSNSTTGKTNLIRFRDPFDPCLLLVRGDIFFKLLASRVVGFLLQELFVLLRRFIFHVRMVVEQREPQMHFGHSQRIESQRFFETRHRVRATLELQIGFAEKISSVC